MADFETNNIDRFTADEGIKARKPPCQKCIHRSEKLPGICTAFPDGIPNVILTGRNNHQTEVEGDHGVRFEPKPGVQ